MSASFKTKHLLAFGFAAAALIALTFASWIFPPGPNKALHSEVARQLATESIKFLKPGGKVTIFARDTAAFPQPAMEHLLSTLQREFKRAGVEVRSIELIQVDPIRPVEVPSGDFYEQLRRLPAGDVILSLLGPPVLGDQQQAKLGRPKASVVAFCGPGAARASDLPSLVKAGYLRAAIVDKESSNAGSSPSPANPNSFDTLYRIVRDESALASTASP